MIILGCVYLKKNGDGFAASGVQQGNWFKVKDLP